LIGMDYPLESGGFAYRPCDQAGRVSAF
jgi:hypothetical protein